MHTILYLYLCRSGYAEIAMNGRIRIDEVLDMRNVPNNYITCEPWRVIIFLIKDQICTQKTVAWCIVSQSEKEEEIVWKWNTGTGNLEIPRDRDDGNND